jgi:hypothetical protein
MFSVIKTYAYLQSHSREVQIRQGFVPKTCWIADVLVLSGKRLRVAPNRIESSFRQHPCPPERRPAIIEALRDLERQVARCALGVPYDNYNREAHDQSCR